MSNNGSYTIKNPVVQAVLKQTEEISGFNQRQKLERLFCNYLNMINGTKGNAEINLAAMSLVVAEAQHIMSQEGVEPVESTQCPNCQRVSFSAGDVANEFCGDCGPHEQYKKKPHVLNIVNSNEHGTPNFDYDVSDEEGGVYNFIVDGQPIFEFPNDGEPELTFSNLVGLFNAGLNYKPVELHFKYHFRELGKQEQLVSKRIEQLINAVMNSLDSCEPILTPEWNAKHGLVGHEELVGLCASMGASIREAFFVPAELLGDGCKRE